MYPLLYPLKQECQPVSPFLFRYVDFDLARMLDLIFQHSQMPGYGLKCCISAAAVEFILACRVAFGIVYRFNLHTPINYGLQSVDHPFLVYSGCFAC